jgi:hypothetical protein
MSLMAPIIDLPEVNGGIAPGAKTKFAPPPLIFEGSDGQVVFAEEARLASSRSREQAELFYQQGIKETRVVNARRWRDVQTQHSPEEIDRAAEIIAALDLLRKHALLIKKLRREERKADSNPFRLQSLDAQIEHLHPLAQVAGELVASASNRELALVRALGELSKLDRSARGWKSKARRQVACGLYGMRYDAQKCGRAYFVPFYCRNRYCPHCGPVVHRKLVEKYLRLQQPIAEFLTSNPLYRLRILDITAIKRGERMPSFEDVRKFKADVKKLIEAANHYVANKFGVPYSKQLTGYLYCLEFGFENSNLHCHGVLLSPYLEQDWLSDRWREIRNDGSFRVVIAEAYSFEAAIKHALSTQGNMPPLPLSAHSNWNWLSWAAVA